MADKKVQGAPVRGAHQQGIAFALTGLGGSNAFGVGFLQAALDHGVDPAIISCTSGMIYWTWRYLEAKKLPVEQQRDCLRLELEATIRQAQPFPPALDVLNNLYMNAFGVPGIFRWARSEYFQRFFTTPWTSPLAQQPKAMWDVLLPAQQLVSTRSQTDFERMAEAFRASPVGVCFNSFLPESSREFLHANDRAKALLNSEKKRMQEASVGDYPLTSKRDNRVSLPETTQADIDAGAIEDALWLTLYGANSKPRSGGLANRIDGAYLRSIILSELTMVEKVFMPRPVALERTAPPANWFEGQDFQTELWWNSSYAPQVSAIEFVNRLVRSGRINDKKFGEVDLCPIEIDVDRGFFLYFKEDLETFRRGYNAAYAAFEEHGLLRPEGATRWADAPASDVVKLQAA